MLMIFGLFVFDLYTAPFDTRSRDINYKWSANDPIGDSPSYQFLGKGEESMTLSGTLYPELTGGPLSLEVLNKMAEKGEPYLLMGGDGRIFGYYFVDKISHTDSYLLRGGIAQKIGFTLSLKRYDKDLINTADLTEFVGDTVANIIT